MIYKNYISGKNLSPLDIYISIFFPCFYYHCWTFFYSSSYYYYCLGFFCKLWRLVSGNCNFFILIFCIIYILVCLVLITNICYLLTYLLTCLLACFITYLLCNFFFYWNHKGYVNCFLNSSANPFVIK